MPTQDPCNSKYNPYKYKKPKIFNPVHPFKEERHKF